MTMTKTALAPPTRGLFEGQRPAVLPVKHAADFPAQVVDAFELGYTLIEQVRDAVLISMV